MSRSAIFRTTCWSTRHFYRNSQTSTKFKEDLWKQYLKARQDLYFDLMKRYEDAEKRRKEIEAVAAAQRTQWEEVIQSFNERFIVPFELKAENRIAVMLGDASIITLGFIYLDGTDRASVDRGSLLKVLSMGELKAFYVLNILFAARTRQRNSQETLFVIDDIADSFDYQNKYAIIQYLQEISRNPLFKVIIMTHNFDFFRTLESRFVSYNACLMTLKKPTGAITLEKATGIRNAFLNDLKKGFFKDIKKRIASIPFMRNLVEFTKGENDAQFAKLTSLLHWRPDSDSVTEADLDAIYKGVFGTNGDKSGGAKMVDLIQTEAEACLTAPLGINFENKIVLCIATRLKAEKFMIDKINNNAFVAGIKSHQTQTLAEKFKNLFPAETKNVEILDRVALMTPENIHLNSFMYEPIVDMSDEHLRRLYSDVLKLK